MATLKTLMVRLGMDTKRFKSGVTRSLGLLDSLIARSAKLNGLAKVNALAIMASGALQLTSALLPALGVVAALPAALVAVKVATLVTKVGMQGMGEAMSAVASGDAAALDAALKKLSPAAQGVVKQLAGLKKKAWDPLQKAVQQKLFENVTKPLAAATANVLPAAKKGMVGVAAEINGVGREGLRVAATPFFRGELTKVFAGTAGVVKTLKGGVSPLVTILLRLATLGLPLVKQFLAWAIGGAKTAAAFLASERGAAKMTAIIQRAGATLATLGRIAANIGAFLAGIFKGANTDGAGLLATIESLTARMAAWSSSAAGQQQLATVFGLIADTARELGPILSVVVGPLGAIAGLILSLPAPAQGVVTQVLAFATVAGLLGSKLAPLVSGLRLLYGGALKLGPALVTGSAAVQRFGVTVATTAAGFVINAAKMVVAMTTTAARVVAGWVLMGAQALAQAARVALAWLIAMGPIGLIIAAVVAVVALIIANWDKIKEVIAAVWEWIKDKTGAAWDWLKSKIQAGVKAVVAAVTWLKELPGKVAAWFSQLAQSAIKKAGEVVDWLKGLPGRILSALGNLGSLLLNAGKDLLTGLWNGILGLAGWLKDKILGFFSGIMPDWVRKALGIASPSKVMALIGKMISYGVAKGMDDGLAKIKASAAKLTDLVKKALDGPKEDRLVAVIKSGTAKLRDLVTERNALLEVMKAAQDKAAEVTDAARSFAGLTNLGDSATSAAGIQQGLQQRLSQLRQFGTAIKKLAKRGLNKALMGQIIAAGPQEGLSLAKLFLDADSATFGAINSAQAGIDKAAKNVGNTAASALFDAGKQSGKGFLSGIKSQIKTLESQMVAIGKSMAEAIKKALKIKSPSKVMFGVGGNTMLGILRGVMARRARLLKAASKIAIATGEALTPPPPRFGGTPGGDGPGGPGPGVMGKTTIINVTTHNPVAEPTSKTTNRTLQYAGALGM
ncbi:hypothetical protein Aple_010790 [Acrocarpospora pleiomorpha]|uniref:Tape measure protein n=1 Tax=Acrocarpospora pleiomorpha TaxID=90975 RepID=A0A5M3XAL8_9ACTN|nr:hypothetical protein [Acrocarpospora pleiomorpha]GES18184.1 hypothetical protein Aple_010790 [Acrocarpospora pleiomorpha]